MIDRWHSACEGSAWQIPPAGKEPRTGDQNVRRMRNMRNIMCCRMLISACQDSNQNFTFCLLVCRLACLWFWIFVYAGTIKGPACHKLGCLWFLIFMIFLVYIRGLLYSGTVLEPAYRHRASGGGRVGGRPDCRCHETATEPSSACTARGRVSSAPASC